jgi:regulator of replication initiation timing
MAITGTVPHLLETSNLPVYSVWEDMKELMIRAAAELAKSNAENARLRIENEQLSERVKAAEGWHG